MPTVLRQAQVHPFYSGNSNRDTNGAIYMHVLDLIPGHRWTLARVLGVYQWTLTAVGGFMMFDAMETE